MNANERDLLYLWASVANEKRRGGQLVPLAT